MSRILVVSGLLLAGGCTRDPGTESDPSTTLSNTGESGADASVSGVVDPTTGPSTDPGTSDPGATGSETGAATTVLEPTTAGTGDPSATGDTGGIGRGDCDVFVQDCDEGEKCAAWGDGNWNATKCVPVHGKGAPGDSCLTMGGRFSGLDDCQKGAMCWDTDDMMKGSCIELCTGTPDAPICSEGGPCIITSEVILNLCLPPCDPLAQDCPNAKVCVSITDNFVCVVDASGEGGASYAPCEFINACDPGNFCDDPSLAPMNCDPKAAGCCIPFCNLDEMPTCPGKNTTCKPYYDEGMAPPMMGNIGACIE